MAVQLRRLAVRLSPVERRGARWPSQLTEAGMTQRQVAAAGRRQPDRRVRAYLAGR